VDEAKRKSRNRADILARETHCIYCDKAPTSVEHMPPLGMFINRYRPSGMVFACCDQCNQRTGVADLVASFFARLGQGYTTDGTLLKRGRTAEAKTGAAGSRQHRHAAHEPKRGTTRLGETRRSVEEDIIRCSLSHS
jgi:hypothetical protein